MRLPTESEPLHAHLGSILVQGELTTAGRPHDSADVILAGLDHGGPPTARSGERLSREYDGRSGSCYVQYRETDVGRCRRSAAD